MGLLRYTIVTHPAADFGPAEAGVAPRRSFPDGIPTTPLGVPRPRCGAAARVRAGDVGAGPGTRRCGWWACRHGLDNSGLVQGHAVRSEALLPVAPPLNALRPAGAM